MNTNKNLIDFFPFKEQMLRNFPINLMRKKLLRVIYQCWEQSVFKSHEFHMSILLGRGRERERANRSTGEERQKKENEHAVF